MEVNQFHVKDVDEGAFQISRSIFNSEIWYMPPHYLKVWVWLIGKAFYKPRKNLKRGQCRVTLNETIEATKWKVGYRTEKLTRTNVWKIYEWLRERNMVETMKATRGMVVTICNYDLYQNLVNYEVNDEGTMKDMRSGTLKKKKVIKKENNTNGRFAPPTAKEVEDYGNQIDFEIDGERFCAYYESRGWFLSKGVKMKSWKQTVVTWKKNWQERNKSENDDWQLPGVNI